MSSGESNTDPAMSDNSDSVSSGRACPQPVEETQVDALLREAHADMRRCKEQVKQIRDERRKRQEQQEWEENDSWIQLLKLGDDKFSEQTHMFECLNVKMFADLSA
jgi:hypothetical protein